ncbi:MAG: GNAT family N-acetyltransferase [Roseivivax sp.]|nr:GNAT family N-acetyltransferase [Roseivivax sp.]
MTAPVEQHRPGRAARQASKIGARVPVLDTRRLQLRAPRVYDFAAYAGILCDERAQYMGGPFTREDAWLDFTQNIAIWLLHGHGMWTIDAQTTPSAGFVLLGFEYSDPEPELGLLLTAGAEGHGYAQEAAQAALTHAWTDLGWDTVVSYVDPQNARCIATMTQLGARRDRTAEATLADGSYVFRHNREAV